jgi:7 transmembrane sweet-taste receptor of 3 GCPR
MPILDTFAPSPFPSAAPMPIRRQLPEEDEIVDPVTKKNTTCTKQKEKELAAEEGIRSLQFFEENTTAARGSLLAGMLQTRFHGASGILDFGEEVGKERDSEYVTVGLYNIRPENTTSGRPQFFAVLVSTNNNSDWTNVKGTAIVYRDGTTVQPGVEREYENENFLAPGVRAIGLILMSIAWLLSFTALVLLHVLSKDNVVQRAQPFFLKMLCVGSIVMSTAIFTLSWDEGAGWSDQQLDIACALTPWFFFIGQILTFCALFTKLWRVDKVLQFRRRAVTISNVMKPL